MRLVSGLNGRLKILIKGLFWWVSTKLHTAGKAQV